MKNELYGINFEVVNNRVKSTDDQFVITCDRWVGRRDDYSACDALARIIKDAIDLYQNGATY